MIGDILVAIGMALTTIAIISAVRTNRRVKPPIVGTTYSALRTTRQAIPQTVDLLLGKAAAAETPPLSPIQSAKQKIEVLVAEHLPTLVRRRMALIKVDSYGVVDAKGWMRECQHFVDKVVRPKLSEDEAQAVAAAGLSKLVPEMLEEPAREECARIEAGFNYNEDMSPLDYERFCAARLEAVGWTCELTKGSGDQGADVVARKNGIVLVIQCKKYSSPVGNGAVQEAVAAKGHLKAHFAAVVSNASFTRSAVELASSTRTLLLNHAELDIIDARLKAV